MNGAFYIGATGLNAEQRALDVVAANITNMNTSGYKRAQLRFSEVIGRPDAANGVSAAGQGLGVAVDADGRDFTPGELRQTARPLDVAIDGDGFFELLGPGGQTLLWRGGAMKVNADGYLAAANGMPLRSMISTPIDTTAITVAIDGKVTAMTGSAAEPVVLGQIDLVRAKDVASLTPAGEGLYRVENDADLLTAAPGEDGVGMLAPGSVEASNVELTSEMVTLLLLQRAYSASAQVIQAGDQLMAIANDLRK